MNGVKGEVCRWFWNISVLRIIKKALNLHMHVHVMLLVWTKVQPSKNESDITGTCVSHEISGLEKQHSSKDIVDKHRK